MPDCKATPVSQSFFNQWSACGLSTKVGQSGGISLQTSSLCPSGHELIWCSAQRARFASSPRYSLESLSPMLCWFGRSDNEELSRKCSDDKCMRHSCFIISCTICPLKQMRKNTGAGPSEITSHGCLYSAQYTLKRIN